jgi:hypothetical protein
MKHVKRLGAALAAACLTATLGVAADGPNLEIYTLTAGGESSLEAQLTGGSGDGFLLVGTIRFADAVAPSSVRYFGVGLPVGGHEQARVPMPDPASLPAGVTLELTALWLDDGQISSSGSTEFTANPKFCEVLDFNWGPGGVPLQTGEWITSQYASVGLQISAVNNEPTHPDKAIIFDSSNPTGDDWDLQTPGYGLYNDFAFGNLLIIAENDYDGDGDLLVDDPDDEEKGGDLSFYFDAPVDVCEVTLIDHDGAELCDVECFDEYGVSLGVIAIAALDDNSRQTVGLDLQQVTHFQLRLTGSAGVGRLKFVPCPTRTEFDTTLFGTPLELPAGTIMTNQLSPKGVTISAINNNPLDPDAALMFDTGFITGGDTDLVTPGYGYGNDLPRGNVLIIAENLIDGDGDSLVDDPDDEWLGGTLTMCFADEVTFISGTVLDVDYGETAWFEAFDGGGFSLGTFFLNSLGDNSLETVMAGVSGVRAVNLNLSGSGAWVDIEYCPDADMPE